MLRTSWMLRDLQPFGPTRDAGWKHWFGNARGPGLQKNSASPGKPGRRCSPEPKLGNLQMICPGKVDVPCWKQSFWPISYKYRSYNIDQLMGLREKLQETPMFMGKSGWFPVKIFPFLSTLWIDEWYIPSVLGSTGVYLEVGLPGSLKKWVCENCCAYYSILQ